MKKITRLFLLVFTVILFAGETNAQCGCWVQRDASWSVAPFVGYTAPLYRNDDGSTAAITIPFSYCFFGTTETSLYINNNGNISFGAAYTAFTPLTLPVASYSMLAPFWADVDTRLAPSGVVYYKITPTHMIVQWDSVGYYNEHDDKLNSFEVIISNGHDPIIPYGNNTEFCYGQMQWTTGDASGGTNGFGGTPALVGANKGDGVSYLQYGLFDRAGAAYLGPNPATPYDGVGWLDNQTFIFDGCTSVTPPSVSGVSPCDTIQVCVGDTTRLHIYFFSSKATLTTHSALSPPVLSGVTIPNNWPGNTDSLILQIIGSAANYGIHTVNLYGYDNATPHDTSWVSFVLKVDSGAIGTLVLRKDTICPGSSTSLKANGHPGIYAWSTGSTKDSIIVSPPVTTTYTVTIGTGECALHLSKTVVIDPLLKVKIDTLCKGKAIADLKATPDSGISTFNYTGTVQSFTVPAGVTTVTITVVGAKGGGTAGGNGASFAGSCAVTPGHVLSVVVGQQGTEAGADGGGGGGGSYVWDNANTNLPIAAAGGGGGEYWTAAYSGGVGGTNLVTHACPVGGGTAGHGADGAAGNGGTGGSVGTGPGAAGAGWLSNGGNVIGSFPCTGGSDRATGFAGGPGYSGNSTGGYGGGGGGGFDAGAGGGGYNGGGGGNDGTGNGGDGGGSYLNGVLIGVAGDTGAGNGYVSIKYNTTIVGGTGPYTYAWTPTGGTRDTATGLSNGTYTVTVRDKIGCTATASVTITCGAALPIELLSFDAVYDNIGNIVKLNWSTASEINNDYFTIERSQDGKTFTNVTKVAGAGNSDATRYYAALDPDILGGVVYYRLKQTDFDGQYTYSQIDAVNEGEPGGDVLIIPNPASSSVNVEFEAPDAGQKEVIRMYDCTGRQVISDKTIISEQGMNSARLDISELSNGVYVIRVDTPNKTFYKKCIKN